MLALLAEDLRELSWSAERFQIERNQAPRGHLGGGVVPRAALRFRQTDTTPASCASCRPIPLRALRVHADSLRHSTAPSPTALEATDSAAAVRPRPETLEPRRATVRRPDRPDQALRTTPGNLRPTVRAARSPQHPGRSPGRHRPAAQPLRPGRAARSRKARATRRLSRIADPRDTSRPRMIVDRGMCIAIGLFKVRNRALHVAASIRFARVRHVGHARIERSENPVGFGIRRDWL